MIPILLLNKIMQLAVFMLLGFILVKLKIIKSQDSTILSKISLYLLMPAAIIKSFDVEISQDILNGILLAFGAAIAIHILLFIMDRIFGKLFRATNVERASVMYSNAANLIIPIVGYVLGEEWVIYSCAYMSVQLVFLWTHGIGLFSKEQRLDVKKILLNVNLIAIATGVIFLLIGFRLPHFAKEIISPLGDMLGTVGMIIAGMLAAKINFRKMLANKRLYLVLVMRLIICPIFVLAAIKGIALLVDIVNTEKILLVSFLASITPSAATIMQFAQIHNEDSDFATSINIVTTLTCIATMPAFVWIYNLI